ncbi:MAG: guanine deaminase [Candidatus Eiseniibacteriota bacterium]
MSSPTTAKSDDVTVIRGPALTYTGDPFVADLATCRVYESDAAIVMTGGHIVDFGPASRILPNVPRGTTVTRYPDDALILPGFVDCHVHYPQTEVIGAYGAQLLDWLDRYIFASEQRFADPAHARAVARAYLAENLRNGVTSAAVFCTVHPQSVDVLFEEAEALGLRMIAGKAIMDRNAPDGLLTAARDGEGEARALIKRWYGRGRAVYALTPRFAPTSTPEQLEATAALWREFPGTILQSHLSENHAEIAWVRDLFPEARDYVDVYDRFGLLGPRAIYGHGIHLSEIERGRLADTGTAIAHCPTSNLFLGSGLFDIGATKAAARPIRVGLATDLGAGTSFSMLRTMGAAYEVAQLKGQSLSAGHAFYLATRGSAEALYLDDHIGSIAPGMEADLVVLDLKSTPIIAFRMKTARDLDEALFVQMTMADDRAVRATYVAGRLAYERAA